MKRIIIFFLSTLLGLHLYGQQKFSPQKIELESRFDFKTFFSPPIKFAPYARWWWPGNDVTQDELEREIRMFASNGFGGVEIQPLNIGIPISQKTKSRILGWDTPEYYSNLNTVLKTAREVGMKVDLTNGSGWPAGGAYLSPSDGFLSLGHSDTLISGGQTLKFRIPTIAGKRNLPLELQAVVASKVLPKAIDTLITITLDSTSTEILTGLIKDGSITWNVPEGTWKIIAFWAVQSEEMTNIAASEKQGPVLDHLDSIKVLKNYNHLLGDRTGLQPYMGNTLHAVFNDSYEFKVDRHYAFDLLPWFKEHRGYNIEPWLPAILQKGYNMVEYMNPHADPYYRFSGEDWRLKYDYDLTVGELLSEHFFKTSLHYLETKGVLHRTQPYGLPMDMIAMAGMASIPETESMNGSEGRLKITASGANLYNRPLISAESVVYGGRAYTTTPQMIRLSVDKLFAAGVNQIVYHGIPYLYFNEKLPKEGWYPFSSPFLSFINFSSNLGENNPFWKFQKGINEYVTRTQYAMRTGLPVADVLIYYSFLSFTGLTDNPGEIFTNGYIEKNKTTEERFKDPQANLVHDWILKVWPLINELEKNGITWNWVNDKSIQEANITGNNELNIRGNIYQGLIIANAPYIQIESAKRIHELTYKGLNLLITGNIPDKQPSFLNWKENDKKTKEYLDSSLLNNSSKFELTDNKIAEWITDIKTKCPVRFNDKYTFIRQSQRELGDGSRVHFIWNTSDTWKEISLSLNSKFSHFYLLNAEDGSIRTIGSGESIILPPFCSRILFASTQVSEILNNKNTESFAPSRAQKVISLDCWSLKTETKSIAQTQLFDWRSKEDWKYESHPCEYQTIFNLKKIQKKAEYFLDLGDISYTAELYVNGRLVDTCLYLPYVSNVTRYLKKGENQVTVRVVPTLLNGFIGQGNSGDKKYRQFKEKNNDLMSEGLLGPVKLYKMRLRR